MGNRRTKASFRQIEFDAAFGGARRDEEKSRAKEHIFSGTQSIDGNQIAATRVVVIIQYSEGSEKVCVFSLCQIGLKLTLRVHIPRTH